MAYSQEKFDKYFSKMEAFQKIAADNGVSLKKVLIKLPDMDGKFAYALIRRYGESKKNESVALAKSHITCPKCGSDKIENGECLLCGIVLAKYKQVQEQKQNPDITLRFEYPNTKANFTLSAFFEALQTCSKKIPLWLKITGIVLVVFVLLVRFAPAAFWGFVAVAFQIFIVSWVLSIMGRNGTDSDNYDPDKTKSQDESYFMMRKFWFK